MYQCYKTKKDEESKNPSPNSIPFIAGIENIAFAKFALNFSKTGSPNPNFTLNIFVSTTAPILSPFKLIKRFSASLKISLDFFKNHQKLMVWWGEQKTC